MDTSKKSSEAIGEEQKKDIGEIVGDLVVSGATVLAHTAAQAVVKRVRKAAAKTVEPGRFDNFLGDAGEILGKEAIAVLYALVIAGPFILLAALAILGERARRRRADHRLLEETG